MKSTQRTPTGEEESLRKKIKAETFVLQGYSRPFDASWTAALCGSALQGG